VNVLTMVVVLGLISAFVSVMFLGPDKTKQLISKYTGIFIPESTSKKIDTDNQSGKRVNMDRKTKLILLVTLAGTIVGAFFGYASVREAVVVGCQNGYSGLCNEVASSVFVGFLIGGVVFALLGYAAATFLKPAE
jgi:hypothetical protein